MSNWQRVSERRTQIYLPDDIYRAVKDEGRKQGVSMAQIIRQTLAEHTILKNTAKKTNNSWKKLMSLAGSIKGEPEDFSSNISKYIAQMYNKKP